MYVDIAFSFLSSLPPPPRPKLPPINMSNANNNVGNNAGGARGAPGRDAGGNGGEKSGGGEKGKGKRPAVSPPPETPEEKRARLERNREFLLLDLEEQEREYTARAREMEERARELAQRRAELQGLSADHPDFGWEWAPALAAPVDELFAEREETPPRKKGDFEEPLSESTSEVGSVDRVWEGASQYAIRTFTNRFFVACSECVRRDVDRACRKHA